MPAAAVIPAPIAYINVAAVKRLVVEFLTLSRKSFVNDNGLLPDQVILLESASALHWVVVQSRSFTVSKSECSKQAVTLVCISME